MDRDKAESLNEKMANAEMELGCPDIWAFYCWALDRDQAATDLEARVREMETQLSAAQNALSTIGEAVEGFKAGQVKPKIPATKADLDAEYTSWGTASAWASGMDGVIE